MDEDTLKIQLLKKIGSYDLTIGASALNTLQSFIQTVTDCDWTVIADILIKELNNKKNSYLPISDLQIKEIIENYNKLIVGDLDEPIKLNLIDAFSMEKVIYLKNKFLLTKISSSNFLEPNVKLNNFYISRYEILYQCLIRSEILIDKTTEKPINITSIDNLRNVTTNDKLILFGMIYMKNDDSYVIEDPINNVTVDLTDAVYVDQLITLNSFVLVEGVYSNNIFKIQTIGNPPIPAPNSYINQCLSSSLNDEIKVKNLISKRIHVMIFSDVWLNKQDVMRNLYSQFENLSKLPKIPFLFVFCGNFVSIDEADNYPLLKSCFRWLMKLIIQFPSLKESHFVFVPGPKDCGLNGFIPRHYIPSTVWPKFSKHGLNFYFTSNPIRINIENRTILVYRDEIIDKVAKSTIKCPTSTESIPKEYVHTAISQGTLCPIPPSNRKLLWNYEHVLDLYPSADLAIISSNFSTFVVKENHCTFVNPGCYSRNGYKYIEYDMKITN